MRGCERPRSFLRGVGETLGIVAAFVAAGLLAGRLAQSDPARPPGAEAGVSYTQGRVDPEDGSEPRLWLVDGFNALHVAVLRGRARDAWWTRAGREELLARVRGFDDPAAEVWVVFDGPDPREEGAPAAGGGPRVAFARSADDWLLERARRAAAGEVAIVTADRRLADRARARGARVVSPHAFLARCGAAPSGEGS
jgi:hypothetical protein